MHAPRSLKLVLKTVEFEAASLLLGMEESLRRLEAGSISLSRRAAGPK
jgi:hypothetical protein